MILPAGEGRAIVAMNTNDYTTTFQTTIKPTTRQQTKEGIQHHALKNLSVARNKIHKQNLPLRPIMNATGSPAYELSKYLANILSPLQNNKYTK